MKKTFIITMAVLLMMISIVPVYGISHSATPRYGNVIFKESTFEISDSGLAEVVAKYEGYSYTFWVTISIKLERRALFNWEIVENGCYNNIYTEESSATSGCTTYTFQLNKKGLYRATIEYSIYGNGGYEPDYITDVIEYQYT